MYYVCVQCNIYNVVCTMQYVQCTMYYREPGMYYAICTGGLNIYYRMMQ